MIRLLPAALAAILCVAPAAAGEPGLAELDRDRLACLDRGDYLCAFETTDAMYHADFATMTGDAVDPHGFVVMGHLAVGTELALGLDDAEAKLRVTDALFWMLVRYTAEDWRANCFLICIARAEALAASGDVEQGAEFARAALANRARTEDPGWSYQSFMTPGDPHDFITREEAAARLDALEATYEGRL